GDQTTNTAVIRTGGATDGATHVAHQVNTGAALSIYRPFEGTPLVQWNATTAANLTLTLYGMAFGSGLSAIPTNADFWFDVEYLGTSGNPLGSFQLGGVSSVLTTGSSLTAD